MEHQSDVQNIDWGVAPQKQYTIILAHSNRDLPLPLHHHPLDKVLSIANIYIISSTWVKSFRMRAILIEIVLLTFNLSYFKLDSNDLK